MTFQIAVGGVALFQVAMAFFMMAGGACIEKRGPRIGDYVLASVISALIVAGTVCVSFMPR